jgi:hypothetical protein
METAGHDRRDQLVIAALTGIASRHAGLKTRGGYDQAAAVAELHEVSTDPHLLAHATQVPKHWQYRTIKAMLIAAGASEDDIVAIAEQTTARLERFGFPVGEMPQE